MISSSAVYANTELQPYKEEGICGPNKYWGDYGVDKRAGEIALLSRVSNAYIIRPPYLYGPMENLYREPFVFECALKNRPFYLPKDGEMKLQFFHIKDLCKFIEIIIEKEPKEHIFNVGNKESVSIKEWVRLCYKATGRTAEYKNVYNLDNQKKYFCFTDYEYSLDVSLQEKYFSNTIDLEQGIKESFDWYIAHIEDSAEHRNSKDYIEFVDRLYLNCKNSI